MSLAPMSDFSGGVALALPPEKQEKNSSPRAFNTALFSVPNGGVALTKRPGYRMVANPTGVGTITGMEFFRHDDNGSIATHLIGLASDGKLWDLLTNTEIASGILGAADGCRFVAANNCLIGVTGQQSFKLYKKPSVNTVYFAPVGFAAPSVAPTQDSLAAGDMTGNYDFGITYYNEHTGTESNLSELLSVVLSGNEITVNFTDTPATEVTHRRVYMRKQQIMTKLVGDSTMQVPIANSSAVINITDTVLNNFTILAPDTVENSPMPDGIVDVAWHLSRLFATDGAQTYYSKVGNPEQWDPDFVEPVNKHDNQRQTGLMVLSEGALAVFKERSIYIINGQSPQTWEISRLSDSLGCVSRFSLVEGDDLIAFESAEGPCLWGQGQPPTRIADAIVIPLARQGALTLNVKDHCKVGFDPIAHRFLFSLNSVGTPFGQWAVIPFNTLLNTWEALGWDLPTIGAFCTGPSQTGERRVFFSSGMKVYELDPTVSTDAAGNTTGVGLHLPIAAVASPTSLTVSAASVPAGAGRCAIIDRRTLAVHRTTATLSGASPVTVTLAAPLPFTPAPESLIIFDCPVLEWDSPVISGDSVLFRKRWLFIYTEHAANLNTPYLIGLAIDSPTPVKVWNLTLKGNHPLEWAPASEVLATGDLRWRGRIAYQGKQGFIRFVGYYPESKWALLATAVSTKLHHGW